MWSSWGWSLALDPCVGLRERAAGEVPVNAVKVPLLANITEFGKTDLYSTDELGKAGVDMALYPLSAFRAMSQAALNIYEAIRKDGTQKLVLDQMQTREDLYDCLDYHSYEEKIDQLLKEGKS